MLWEIWSRQVPWRGLQPVQVTRKVVDKRERPPVPAGMPAWPGEPWEEVAQRELEEETGWQAGRLIPLTRIYTTPGFTDEVIYLWLATELESGTSKLDRDEFLELVRIPLSTALEWVQEGRIIDGKSVAALLFAARFALPTD